MHRRSQCGRRTIDRRTRSVLYYAHAVLVTVGGTTFGCDLQVYPVSCPVFSSALTTEFSGNDSTLSQASRITPVRRVTLLRPLRQIYALLDRHPQIGKFIRVSSRDIAFPYAVAARWPS